MSTYEEFIQAKVRFDTAYGFSVDPAVLHSMLKPHQRLLVEWALHGPSGGS